MGHGHPHDRLRDLLHERVQDHGVRADQFQVQDAAEEQERAAREWEAERERLTMTWQRGCDLDT